MGQGMVPAIYFEWPCRQRVSLSLGVRTCPKVSVPTSNFTHSPLFSVETPNEMNFDDVFSASFSAASNALDEPKTEPEPKPEINQTVVTQTVTQPVSQTVKLAVQKPDVPKPVSKMPKPDLKRSATPGKIDHRGPYFTLFSDICNIERYWWWTTYIYYHNNAYAITTATASATNHSGANFFNTTIR